MFHTLSQTYLQILSSIISLVDQIPSNLFHCFNVLMISMVFGLKQKIKKIKSLGNSDVRADQKTGWNDDNTLEIPRTNLELKHMFILCP